MAISANLTTYEDGSILDSYTAGIVNIDPSDTPFTSNRPVVKVNGMQHETFVDSLYLVSSSHTVAQGSDTSTWMAEAPTSRFYKMEILRAPYKVARHEYDAQRKTGINPFKREREKAGKAIKMALEDRAILGTGVSGTTNVAPRMAGIVSLLSSYTYTTATQAFTESGLASYLTDAWARGAKIDELYLPMSLKRKMATFVGSETVVNSEAKDRRIISRKDFYESDATELLKLFKSRVLTNFASGQAGLTNTLQSIMFGVQSDLVKIGVFGSTTTDEDKPDSLYDTYRGKMQMTAGLIFGNAGGGFVAINNQ